MGSFVYPLYAFSFLLALFVVFTAFTLVKKYRLVYLKYYFYFLLTFNIIILVNMGKFHIFVIVQDQPAPLFMLIMSSFNLLVYPLFPITLYSFMLFIMNLMEIEVSSLLKKAQFLFWTVLFVFLIYATINFQGTKDPSLIMSLYQVIGIVIHASLFFIIMTLFFYIKNITNKKKRREIRNFGILYFICLVITDFVGPRFSSLLGLYHLPVQFLTAPLLQIPPLFYLKRYLQKYYVKSSLMEDRSDELSLLFEKKKISSREREVLQLILEGKSNAEIEKALFISPHTVRNHIYNIYQKLGVQNRIQVVNLMHATLRKDNGKIQNSLV